MEQRGWRDLLERIAKLEQEQEEQKKKKELYDKTAREVGVIIESFCENGFSREEAMDIVKTALKYNK